LPPLIVSEAEIADAVERIDRTCGRLAQKKAVNAGAGARG
jgi:hypothetical protein